MIGLRVVLVVLGLTLGLVLLSQGHVLVGGLISAMAVVRGVLLYRWQARAADRMSRREAFQGRMRHRRGY